MLPDASTDGHRSSRSGTIMEVADDMDRVGLLAVGHGGLGQLIVPAARGIPDDDRTTDRPLHSMR
jgi:hypothetical protein